MDGGVADEGWLDGLEEGLEARGINEAAGDHGGAIESVAGMAALDFGEGLGVGIVVVEVELAVPCDEWAALFPAGDLGDEKIGTGELDVDVEGFFEGLDGFEETSGLGVGFEVDVYGGIAPAVKDGGGAPDEINTPVAAHMIAEGGAEGFQAVFIGEGSHGE